MKARSIFFNSPPADAPHPWRKSAGEKVAGTLSRHDLKQADEPAWKKLAISLNHKAVQDLEAISTILYLQANGFVDDKLRTRFGELKPSLKSLYNKALKDSRSLSKVEPDLS